MQMPTGTEFYTVINGTRVFTSQYLTMPEEFDEEMPRTFFHRWIEPLLHPATIPFEPWRKTKRERGTRQVPSNKAMVTPMGIVVHPAILGHIRNLTENTSIAI